MGRNPFQPKAPVKWPQQWGGEGKKQARPGSLQAQIEMASSQTPFANSYEHRKQDCTKVCKLSANQ